MIYKAEIWVNAPPQKVFDVIADVERMFVFGPEVKSITITSEVKKGVGVKSHWVAERDGVVKEWDEEVTDYDPACTECSVQGACTVIFQDHHIIIPDNPRTANTIPGHEYVA